MMHECQQGDTYCPRNSLYISCFCVCFSLRESVQADDGVNEELTGMFPVAEGGMKLTNDVGRSPESFECNTLHCSAYERWYYSVGSVILFIWLLVIFVKK